MWAWSFQGTQPHEFKINVSDVVVSDLTGYVAIQFCAQKFEINVSNVVVADFAGYLIAAKIHELSVREV